MSHYETLGAWLFGLITHTGGKMGIRYDSRATVELGKSRSSSLKVHLLEKRHHFEFQPLVACPIVRHWGRGSLAKIGTQVVRWVSGMTVGIMWS